MSIGSGKGESSAQHVAEQMLPVTHVGVKQSLEVSLASKRKLWREASSRYRAKPDQGSRKVLDKEKARIAKWRSGKSQEDLEKVRKQISELKKKRIRQESKNERFWRLLRRKDERWCGYSNIAFGWAIDQARGSGICRHEENTKLPTEFSETTVRSEEMVKIRNEF